MKRMQPKIKHIKIYPIKGCSGIETSQARITESGLVLGNYADHEYMIVTNDPDFFKANKFEYKKGLYTFITQRHKRNPQDKAQGLSSSASIKTEIFDDTMRLTWNYLDPTEVPSDRDDGKEIPIRIWEYEGHAIDQGNGIAEWLSDHLGMKVRLVKAKPGERMARQNYMKNSNHILFHDAYPIHWFPIDSVNELNERSGENFPWESFRPQIVVEGMAAQYEHKIYEWEIAGIPFIDPKPCSRCSVTRVDQSTGKLRKKSPLLSLSEYKKWKNIDGSTDVIFGENMLPLSEGTISIGDEIKIISERDPPLVYG